MYMHQEQSEHLRFPQRLKCQTQSETTTTLSPKPNPHVRIKFYFTKRQYLFQYHLNLVYHIYYCS